MQTRELHWGVTTSGRELNGSSLAIRNTEEYVIITTDCVLQGAGVQCQTLSLRSTWVSGWRQGNTEGGPASVRYGVRGLGCGCGRQKHIWVSMTWEQIKLNLTEARSVPLIMQWTQDNKRNRLERMCT